MYIEFGPDTHKEKRNVIQDSYFDTLMHLRNVISLRDEDCSQCSCISVFPGSGARGLKVASFKNYNALEWESTFTFKAECCKNTDYIKKCFKE